MHEMLISDLELLATNKYPYPCVCREITLVVPHSRISKGVRHACEVSSDRGGTLDAWTLEEFRRKCTVDAMPLYLYLICFTASALKENDVFGDPM